jgi:2-polyprenyl-6-hydroxyphenyl methylase/3-demethylubiquinone-9 3-methyltransferase
LNRTLRSFALAILGAEYVLGWLPRGTHSWDKFLTPEELARQMRGAGLRALQPRGLFFDPLRWDWRLSRDTAVNYVMAAAKKARPRS